MKYEQESKWFKPFTWKHEANTTDVIIELQHGSAPTPGLVANVVTQYLLSIGLTEKQASKKPLKYIRIHGWHIDLVSREFSMLNDWEILFIQKRIPHAWPHAWPSQISIFIDEKKAQLTATRFGV